MSIPRSAARVSRRKLVVMGVLGVGGGALLAACGAPTPTPTPAPAPAKPAEAPKPTEAPKPAAGAPPTAAPAKPTEAPRAASAAPAKLTEPPKSAAGAAPAAGPAVNTGAAGTVRWQIRVSDKERAGAQDYITNVFEKKYEKIKVTIEPAPDGRDEKLITAMVGGNAPDFFETWGDNVAQFADRGQVVDVEPLVKRDFTAEDLKDFYPWQWRDFVLPSGTRFGLPKFVNLMAVIYNKDLFDKAGLKPPDATWTHDTYRDAAIKMSSWKDNKPENWGLYYPVWSWDRFWYKLEAWGANVVDPSDNTKAVFDSDTALAAFEWSRKLMWDDKAMVQRQLTAGQGNDASTQFASGRIAMMEEGLVPSTWAERIQKKIKWGFAHVPTGPKQRRVLGTTNGYSIWKGSKNQDASWELMKALSGTEYQNIQTKTSGRFPIRFSALGDWKKISIEAFPELEEVNLDVAVEAMQQGYPGNRTFFKKDAEARQIIEPALEKVFVVGNTPVNYFKEIAQQVTAKMRA